MSLQYSSLSEVYLSWSSLRHFDDWPLGSGPYLLAAEALAGALIGWRSYRKANESGL